MPASPACDSLIIPVGADAYNSFEDPSAISGPSTTTAESSNPYDKLITACKNAMEMSRAYEVLVHRSSRNRQQAGKMLSEDFRGMIADKTLRELEYARGNAITEPTGQPLRDPLEIDPRVCLTLWVHPTKKIKDHFWCMPREKLHMTALEISHSKTQEFIDTYVDILVPQLPEILSLQTRNRTVLVEPMVSFDAVGIAISFVPAEACNYSYHHLRRDLYSMVAATGVEITSRYALPSAHITIGRFTTAGNHHPTEGGVPIKKWLERIGEINKWLEKVQVKWTLGEEVGMVCQAGRLWYGDGETVMMGEGFYPGS
ncbi:unnamed protein product [Tuber aestivum]|uniref:Uncharacterized protein n=1 Tax=Tuber aestivum TaxID=59557 RepID=A0A292PR13_9PEZI|nr:unnamed protein product [Tuber aestivum]